MPPGTQQSPSPLARARTAPASIVQAIVNIPTLLQDPDRQSRRDRLSASSARRARWACARSPSIPTPMPARCMSRWPTRPCISAPRPFRKAICAATGSSPPRWRRGAEAIHPGYGFLSENPDFVDQVTAAGLVFIGPSAAAIRAMGLKDAAKRLMEKAGVPVVPGYHGEAQELVLLATKAREIGYPVLIKARAGGGGKGMRRVEHPDDFAEALSGARREAKAAFGDDKVLVEKYVDKPRHIEVPGVRRQFRQCRASVRARLLGAAPPPEGDRGGPCPRHDRGDAQRDDRRRGQGRQGDRLFRRRHDRVHRRRVEGAAGPTASGSWR